MSFERALGQSGWVRTAFGRPAVVEPLESRQLLSATLYAFDSISSTPEFLKVDTATGQATDIGTFHSSLQNSIGPIGMFGTNRTSTSGATVGSLYVLEDQQADDNAPILSELETVNPLTGSVAIDHGSTGGAYEYLAILDGDNGFDTQFTIDNNFHTSHLVILNGPNGAPDDVGDTGINIFGGLTTDGTDLYGITWGTGDGLGEELVKLDPATGASTIIGPTGNTEYTNSIAFGSDGVLYAYTANTNQISSIDTTTGAETVVSTVQGSLFLLDIASVGGSGSSGGTTTTPAVTTAVAKTALPSNVVSEVPFKGNESLSITNTTNATTKGSFSLKVFASTDGLIDSLSNLVGNLVLKTLPLQPGQTKTKTVKFTKNVTLPAGQYTLLAQTTDSAGTVTDATAGPTLSVADAHVDLSATAGAVKPASPKLGKPASVQLTLTNTGNIDSNGALTVAVGLSTDGVTVAEPVTTVTFSNVRIKDTGKAVKLALHFVLPTDLDVLSYYPVLTLTQDDQNLTAVGTPFSPMFSTR